MKNKSTQFLKIIQGALVVVFLMAIPASVHSQSCAMCYQSAAASGSRSIHALRTGIIILMFPPAMITFGFFGLAYKKRNTFHENDVNEASCAR